MATVTQVVPAAVHTAEAAQPKLPGGSRSARPLLATGQAPATGGGEGAGGTRLHHERRAGSHGRAHTPRTDCQALPERLGQWESWAQGFILGANAQSWLRWAL